MSKFRATTLVLVLSLAAIASSPALAERNTGTNKRLAEARQSYCNDLKLALDTAESGAEKHSGSKAAKPYADEADQWQAAGERAGCAWAQ